MFDYLAILRDLFGVGDPIGIMTTYTHWRFCRLEKAHRSDRREFLATAPIEFDDPDIHRFVISSLLKRKASKVDKDKAVTTDSFVPLVGKGTFLVEAAWARCFGIPGQT